MMPIWNVGKKKVWINGVRATENYFWPLSRIFNDDLANKYPKEPKATIPYASRAILSIFHQLLGSALN